MLKILNLDRFFGFLICFSKMRSQTILFITLFALTMAAVRVHAFGEVECHLYEEGCIGNKSRSPTANPTSSSSVRINPSAVPTEKGFGIEVISFGSNYDFGIVKGLGRVGAAISPSNSEETYFGPPGLELPEDTAYRKKNQLKYPSQKYNLASAFNIVDNNKSGMSKATANLGLMAKYNKLTGATTTGYGLSGIIGALTYGFLTYKDQTLIESQVYNTTYPPAEKFLVYTYSLGLYFTQFIFDLSSMVMVGSTTSKVDLATLSILHKRMIYTFSRRAENSDKYEYDYVTNTITSKKWKTEYFFGVQYRMSANIMVGALYNYYMLKDISLCATLFL